MTNQKSPVLCLLNQKNVENMKEWYVMEKNIVLLDIKPLMGINGTGLIA